MASGVLNFLSTESLEKHRIMQFLKRIFFKKNIASRFYMSNETRLFVANMTTSKEKELVSIGSSLKICLVAEGEADIHPKLGPTTEWNTGAVHAIVNESNASLVKYTPDGDSQQHKYNKSNLLNSSFIVTSAQ